MLASDQSVSEDDIDELLVSDDLLQFRDQDEDLEENIPEVDSSNERSADSSDEGSIDSFDNATPLRNYGGRIFITGKWSKAPPNARVRTLQHNIISHGCASTLTDADAKDPISIYHKLFDEEMLQQILTWTNRKISPYIK